jgi:hypothetical protein
MNYTFQLRGAKTIVNTSQSPNTIPIPEIEVVLLQENLREYSRIVDDVVRRAKEQDIIVKEWDREIEKQRDLQYRFMFDDVIREIQFLIHRASIRI